MSHSIYIPSLSIIEKAVVNLPMVLKGNRDGSHDRRVAKCWKDFITSCSCRKSQPRITSGIAKTSDAISSGMRMTSAPNRPAWAKRGFGLPI
jgi:hypothetical protein